MTQASAKIALLIALAAAPVAFAQPGDAPAAPATAAAPSAPADAKANADALSDFVHYIRIARYDLAKAFGTSLLDKMPKPVGNAEADKASLTPGQFATMVDSGNEAGRFSETVMRGTRIAELEGVADRLLKAYEAGKLEQARDPQEVAKNIVLLSGNQRQRVFGRERLAFAGEYAMPKLLTALQDASNPSLRAEVRQLLVDMGRSAIMPLCVALPQLDPVAQEQVISILGSMPYRTALPFLYEAHATTQSASVKAAAERAISQIDRQFMGDDAAPALLAALADAYAQRHESLLLFPREENQPVWSYSPQMGLYPTLVATPVFHDMMAMATAERALKIDAARADAVATWLAANFSREINTPAGYVNPLWQPSRPDAMYYAVAAGPSAAQAVLAKALDQKNTAIARRAIAAIERTAGASALSADVAGRRPLLEALRFPSRRVQYEAALALAASAPQASFEGSERVVPILASAVRDVESRYAAVIAADAEVGASIAALLKSQGYTVLPPASSVAQVQTSSGDVPGIDLVVVSLPGRATADALSGLRADRRLMATPVIAMLSAQGELDAAIDATRDPLFRTIREGGDPAAMHAQAKQFLDSAGAGPMSDADTAAYRLRALAALRDVALAGGSVLNAADAVLPLTAALPAAKGEVKLAIADVLSLIADKRAAVAVVDAALEAQGDEQIALMNKAAAGAKRHGSLLEQRQIDRLVELASNSQGPQGTAVAALVGALNLPNRSIVPLILTVPPAQPAAPAAPASAPAPAADAKPAEGDAKPAAEPEK